MIRTLIAASAICAALSAPAFADPHPNLCDDPETLKRAFYDFNVQAIKAEHLPPAEEQRKLDLNHDIPAIEHACDAADARKKAVENLKTWREPAGSGNSLCAPPYHMTATDGCQR